MPDSTVAGIITASATVLIALGGLVTAITVLIPILRQSRKTHEQVEQVHTLVNQQRTDSLRYQVALIEALRAHQIDVPIDQSLAIIRDVNKTIEIPQETK